jgi:hypothetical protein
MRPSSIRHPPSSVPAGGSFHALPKGIWVLGFGSMLMDISSELVHSLLPIFRSCLEKMNPVKSSACFSLVTFSTDPPWLIQAT